MKQDRIGIRLTFFEPLLGTTSGNKDLAKEYIFTKYPGEGLPRDEQDAHPDAEEQLEKTSTVFPRMADGRLMLWDYQIKGFFKDACSMLRRGAGDNGKASRMMKAQKKVIDGCIFVFPRQIPIVLSGDISWCQRPLRAQTAQGERVALANSEMVPVGSSIEFEVRMLDPKLLEAVREWFDYGELRGLGQWRNGSYGRFRWETVGEGA